MINSGPTYYPEYRVRIVPYYLGHFLIYLGFLIIALIIVGLVYTGWQFAHNVSILFGSESPRTYLILTQNSDELRPTGGYINAAGHITFDRGQIVDFVIQDSYAVDQLSEAYPYPPEPIRKYMAADYWVLRDASWSPDFPTTALVAMNLYKLGQGVSSDGVLAFDQHALPYLLQAFEPVEVEGEQVTSDNVIELMRQHWAPTSGDGLDSEWWLQRKSFMISLAENLRTRFDEDFGVRNIYVLVNILQQALAEKHILVYLKDPNWADFLAKRNWDGALHPVQSDYLMVVDANLGFNKAGALVERQLNYRVTLAEDGSAQANVNLVYQHPARKREDKCVQEPRYDPIYEQNMERCYWNYLRLVVPAEAQLISGPSNVVEGQFLLRGQPTTGKIDIAPLGSDKMSWGQLFVLPPESSIDLDYVYKLPPNTVQFEDGQWEYKLYLQKQPGTLEPTAEVMVTLPERSQLLKSDPEPIKSQGKLLTYSLTLKTDQEISILYTMP